MTSFDVEAAYPVAFEEFVCEQGESPNQRSVLYTFPHF